MQILRLHSQRFFDLECLQSGAWDTRFLSNKLSSEVDAVGQDLAFEQQNQTHLLLSFSHNEDKPSFTVFSI